jgi:hypothetical protein
MPKIVFCAALFVLFGGQATEGQPRRSQPQSQTQQPQPQPTATPSAESQNSVGHAAETESERYRKERDAKEDAFRAEQQKQNWIIAGAALANLIAAAAYVIIAVFTLFAINKQARHAEEQVGKMSDQLEAINKQEGHLLAQVEAAKAQVTAMDFQSSVMRQQLAAMEWQAGIMELQGGLVDQQVKAMQGQLDAMKDQSQLTAKQIELMVLNECAYIAVEDFTFQPKIKNHELVVSGKFFNGGRTPAWDFKRQLGVDVVQGRPPVGWTFDWEGKPWEEGESVLILANKYINFSSTPRKVTDAEIAGLNSDDLVILVVGKCEYLDGTGGKQIYTFGVTLDLGSADQAPRALVHYQNHYREKEKSSKN